MQMTEISYWPKRIFFILLRFSIWSVLSIIYWGKRKTVPPVKNPILLKSATKLAAEIREGKLKSEDVIQAYISRILEVEPYINAVVQNRFQDALEEAKGVDTLIESKEFTSQQLAQERPLLGVPFTVKVLLSVKGFRCTAGSLLFADRIATEDAPTVARLKKAGGILLATTNSAEFGGSAETNNLIHGRTCNPYDTTRTSGGSSGGESALLSAAGSVIGIGNDFLGSIRIPSHFCCLFAHKATVGRISNEGGMPRAHPSSAHLLSTGPMCRYAEDLVTMVNVLSSEKEKKIVIDQKIDFKDLKIYYQTEIEHAFVGRTDKDIVQALMKAASYFKKNYNVKVQNVKITLLQKSNGIALHILQGRLPNTIEHVTDGQVKHLNFFIEFLKILLGKASFTLTALIGACLGKSFLFFSQKDVPLYEELDQKLRKEFDSLLDENSVFFYPTLSDTAPYHYEALGLLPSCCYTGVFNCIGLPATQCPMGLSRKGMPIGFQIVGRKGNDALTIACAVELEKAFGGWIAPENTRKRPKMMHHSAYSAFIKNSIPCK